MFPVKSLVRKYDFQEGKLMTRREILKMMFVMGAQTLIPFHSATADVDLRKNHCSGKLSLYNEHTKEHLNLQYLDKKGVFDKAACQRLNRFFRCHYDGIVHPIDPRLFLLLDTVRCHLGAGGRRYCLVSGYRSPSYNHLLCRQDANVAHHSYHTRGMAADITMEGIALQDIASAAKHLKAGGVGNYSNFVHLDVGPVRTWSPGLAGAHWKRAL